MRAWLALVLAAGIATVASGATAAPNTLYRFAALTSGDWSVSVHITAWPGHPAHDAQGTLVWQTLRSGGLLGELDARTAHGAVAETMLVWWDRRAHRLRGAWCARYVDTRCAPFDVTWHGDAAVLAGAFVAGGTHYKWRETIAPTRHDHIAVTVDQGKAGERLTRQITITGARFALRPGVER